MKEKKLPGLLWVLLAILALALLAAFLEFIAVPLIKQAMAGTEPAGTEAALPSLTQAVESRSPETPSRSADAPESTVPTTAAPESSTLPATEPAPSQESTEPLPQPTPTDISVGPGDVDTKAYQSGTVFISEGAGYGAYYFGESASARYCEAVSLAARNLEGKAELYCLICPISTGVMLSDRVRTDLGFSDENQAMAWMYEHMDPLVHAVPVYGALKQHNDNYIYFHTDHHWTALGAYYAYREFCAQKGLRPHELQDFESYVYPGYLGSFLNYSNGSAELKSNADTLWAYIPMGTNEMTTYLADGSGGYSKCDWPIVKDVSSYDSGSYYLGFVAGDQPWSYAHNESLRDGSSALVVKDSYGNAFIPFLVDHYEHLYWIDYRQYRDWCLWAGVEDASISDFVARNSIQDVIIVNNIGSTGSDDNLRDMEQILR